MKYYCDDTDLPGCVGVFLGPGREVVFTGCQVHTEPADLRSHPLAVQLAEECDFRFWFRDERPEPPIYTVPKTQIAAYDSRGGYFVCRELVRLNWSEPLYYIDAGFVCHRIMPVGKTFADMGSTWRETMVPCAEIEAFPDRAAAEKRYPIRSVRELMEDVAD